MIDELVVKRIGFLPDKEGFQPLDHQKQAWLKLDLLAEQVLDILKNVTPYDVTIDGPFMAPQVGAFGTSAVQVGAFGTSADEAAEHVGSQLQFLRLDWI
ncbi:MAG: hypothetical protein C5B49_11375 [Bdellovibrio sp.]|nr:MAG: hypothetical protein C5B49_11375 [Bdellovibrio sp.]